MLHNWLLGVLAIGIWMGNYLVYFAPDIRERRRRPASARYARPRFTAMPDQKFTGPLPPRERQPFPPPPSAAPPPPVPDAEIIPFPSQRRASRPPR